MKRPFWARQKEYIDERNYLYGKVGSKMTLRDVIDLGFDAVKWQTQDGECFAYLREDGGYYFSDESYLARLSDLVTVTKVDDNDDGFTYAEIEFMRGV